MGLLDLLKRPEGKRLEFKRDLSSPDGALKTIVAFANTAGGTLLLGMENHSRNVHGVANPLDEEELLANLTSNRVTPRLVPEIKIRPWRQTQGLALPQARQLCGHGADLCSQLLNLLPLNL